MGSKDQASIPSGSTNHAHNNTTTMQYKTSDRLWSLVHRCNFSTASFQWSLKNL